MLGPVPPTTPQGTAATSLGADPLTAPVPEGTVTVLRRGLGAQDPLPGALCTELSGLHAATVMLPDKPDTKGGAQGATQIGLGSSQEYRLRWVLRLEHPGAFRARAHTRSCPKLEELLYASRVKDPGFLKFWV